MQVHLKTIFVSVAIAAVFFSVTAPMVRGLDVNSALRLLTLGAASGLGACIAAWMDTRRQDSDLASLGKCIVRLRWTSGRYLRMLATFAVALLYLMITYLTIDSHFNANRPRGGDSFIGTFFRVAFFSAFAFWAATAYWRKQFAIELYEQGVKLATLPAHWPEVRLASWNLQTGELTLNANRQFVSVVVPVEKRIVVNATLQSHGKLDFADSSAEREALELSETPFPPNDAHIL